MTKKTAFERVMEEREKALRELNERFKSPVSQRCFMTTKKDARNIVTVLIGLFGFLALFTGFQVFQATLNLSDIRVLISFIIGIASFILAYYLLR